MISNNLEAPGGPVYTAKCCGRIRNTKHCPDCGSFLGITGKTSMLTVRMPEQLYYDLSVAAHQEGISMNQFAALAIHGAIHGGSAVVEKISSADPPDAGVKERGEDLGAGG